MNNSTDYDITPSSCKKMFKENPNYLSNKELFQWDKESSSIDEDNNTNDQNYCHTSNSRYKNNRQYI